MFVLIRAIGTHTSPTARTFLRLCLSGQPATYMNGNHTTNFNSGADGQCGPSAIRSRAHHEKVRDHHSVAHGSPAAGRAFLATQVALPLERSSCGSYCCCHWLGLERGLGFCFPSRHHRRFVASQRGHTFNRQALWLGMSYSFGVYYLASLALQDAARSMSPNTSLEPTATSVAVGCVAGSSIDSVAGSPRFTRLWLSYSLGGGA